MGQKNAEPDRVLFIQHERELAPGRKFEIYERNAVPDRVSVLK